MVSVVASRIESYLDQRQIDYQVLTCETADTSLQNTIDCLHLTPHQVARAVVLKTHDQIAIAVLPFDSILDFNALEQATGKCFEPVPVASVAHLFHDCERGVVPAVGALYQIDTYCEQALRHCKKIAFEAGSHRAMIVMQQAAFTAIMGNARFISLSQPVQHLTLTSAGLTSQLAQFTPDENIQKRIEDIYAIPDCPDNVHELVSLLTQPADTARLLAILDQLPEVGRQLQALIRSGYGANGTASVTDHTIDNFINQAPGYSHALRLVLGLLIWQSLPLPPDGPLGKRHLLMHACQHLQLSQQLISYHGGLHGVDADMACLASLLQHVGYMLIARLFQPEYFLLNRMVQANPTLPVTAIESRMLAHGHAREAINLGHAEIGAWVLRKWGLPDSLCDIIRHHHDPGYQGIYAGHLQLLMLGNGLLKQYGFGDAASQLPEPDHLAILGLDLNKINRFEQQWLSPIMQQQGCLIKPDIL